MSVPFDLAKPNRTIHIGVILMNSETEILDVAPIDFLYGLSKNAWKSSFEGVAPAKLESETMDMEFHWVSEKGTDSPCILTSGIKLVATDSFDTCPPLDIVLMGANSARYTPNEAELAFVRKAYDECSAFLVICGGVLIPLQAGILNGKTATGPIVLIDTVRKQAPEVNWVTKRWVRDGKLWTSGALLNGTDMMTNFMKHYWGGEGGFVDFLTKLGAWPDRDVDYKDADFTGLL
ncbi:class I glutamine amidotransferase-like protein [Fusarium oxysporum f. sp. albedinis]|uniref:DJ-1/PfpI domain-containing protein n=1 Tax=Fusarium oxysporum TaxID=5507 RepID=A0A8H5ACV3_FUSOX|nr:hypothetical protein FOXYS1_6461 [Fusarium oxysporum]KAH7469430.1 hypothetical protein FOMA001_g14392 [Fusarium oxysporum f. sp. matthiolae]KAI3579181.1 class I glutamine amidotransferase-like protein [Fusarium oxysporum f. sp. albedinis]KAJ0151240.1 Efflux pump dotC [Fusarium oxysporum f. sp. albedinis]KAK2474190.1 hypothetical protein H9L39_14150 [Fusarium oxysporum f. sp. albedinis]